MNSFETSRIPRTNDSNFYGYADWESQRCYLYIPAVVKNTPQKTESLLCPSSPKVENKEKRNKYMVLCRLQLRKKKAGIGSYRDEIRPGGRMQCERILTRGGYFLETRHPR